MGGTTSTVLSSLIPNLHDKFYFNERNGLISSMNLLSSSNSNSIEIACKLDSKEEINELKMFVDDFIISNETNEIPDADDLYLSKEKFTVALENYLSNYLKSRTNIYYKNGQFTINTLSNRFDFVINKATNTISISFILSGKLADAFENMSSKYFTSEYFDCILYRGAKGYYDTITAFSKVRLSNSFLDNIRVNEKKVLIAEIAELFKNYNNFKRSCELTYVGR